MLFLTHVIFLSASISLPWFSLETSSLRVHGQCKGLKKADETALGFATPECPLGNHNWIKRKTFYALVVLIPSGLIPTLAPPPLYRGLCGPRHSCPHHLGRGVINQLQSQMRRCIAREEE